MPLLGDIQPGQQPEQRGLAGTGRTEDSEAVARFHAEIDVVQDNERLIAALHLLGESFCLHNRRHEILVL